MSPREIRVHIDTLVIEAVSPADRLRIGAAVQRELGRLLAEEGLPAAIGDGVTRDVVDGGAFVREPLATPSAIGTHVARAVYGALGRCA